MVEQSVKRSIFKQGTVKWKILLLSLVACTVVAGTAYVVFLWNTANDKISSSALAVAQTAGLSVSVQALQSLSVSPEDVEKAQYQQIKSSLTEIIRINNTARFAYVYILKEGKIFFVADSEPVGSKDYSPPGQEYTEATKTDKQPFTDGNTILTRPMKDRWGTWVSVLIPIKDTVTGKAIAVFGMDYSTVFWHKDACLEATLSAALVLAMLMMLLLLSRVLARNESLKAERSKLSAAQDELNNVFEITPDFLCLVNSEGYFLKVNKAWEELVGKQQKDINNMRYVELIHPDDIVETEKAMGTLTVPGERAEFVNRFRSFDGSYRYLEWRTLLLGENYYGAARDITRRMQDDETAKLGVRRQEALLQLNQMPGASMQKIASFVMEETVQLTRSKIGYIALLNEDESELTIHAWSASAMQECQVIDKPVHFLTGKTGLWGECIRQRKPIITNDYQASSPLKKGLPEGHVRLDRHLNVPIFDQGRIVMVAGVGNKQTDYDEADIRQITLLMSALWRVVLRKKSEDALGEASRFSQQVISSVNEGIIVYDRDKRYTLWNSFMERVSGIAAKDMLGHSTEEVFPYLGGTAITQRLERALAGETCEPVELIYNVDNTGRTGWVSETVGPLFDNDGQVIGAIVISHDITGRKLAEEELLKEKQLTDAIFNSVHGILYLYDDNSRLIKWNKKHEELTGYSAEELQHMGLMDWYKDDPNSQKAIMEGVQAAIENGSGDAQATLQKKDGTKIPMHFSACPLYIDGKQYFAGMGMDISVLKNTAEALRQSEEKLRTTLLSVGDGFVSTDQHGRVDFINKVGEALTGWTQEEARGHDLWEVFHIINEYTRDIIENPVQKVLETGKIIELVNHTVLISKDGIERPIEDSAAPITDENGNIQGVVLVFRDFTDKKERQDKIEYLSYHDALTGLYNRRFYEEEFRRLNTNRNLPISIIMGDVNGLKLVNDAFGHEKGDILLQKAAVAMQNACRAEDIVARWGGDEFIILLPKTKKAEAEAVVKRIESLVAMGSDSSINFSISFGWDTKETSEHDILLTLKSAEDSMYRNKTLQSESVRGNAINTIINTLHEKSPREEGHSKRTSALCYSIGQALGLSEFRLKKLQMAGLLHDIGKIAIREEILNKPGRLTDDEWDEMKRHPEIGFRILNSSYEMTELGEFVLMHHEKYDGTGYPRGLAGDQIPLEAKIIGIADAYDAMFSQRSYKKALQLEECIGEIRQNAGSQFDPYIARVFVEKVLGKPWASE